MLLPLIRPPLASLNMCPKRVHFSVHEAYFEFVMILLAEV